MDTTNDGWMAMARMPMPMLHRVGCRLLSNPYLCVLRRIRKSDASIVSQVSRTERSRRSAVRLSQAGSSESHLHDLGSNLPNGAALRKSPARPPECPLVGASVGVGGFKRSGVFPSVALCTRENQSPKSPLLPKQRDVAKTCAARGADYRRAAIGQARF